MEVGILTSSRADYGIYLPLLKKMQADRFFDIRLIVFGSHLNKKRGYTFGQIKADGFSNLDFINIPLKGDRPEDISNAIGDNIKAFSSYWSKVKYDMVFALGDRYEMFAAVASSVPFNIRIAHLHGGETTLGAIDNAFRHSITLMSEIHFACAEIYRNRICEIKGNDSCVYNVGALSIDNLKNTALLSIADFRKKYKVDLSKPSILITFHPETMAYEKNSEYANELISALREIRGYQYIITMPNTDTQNLSIRKKLEDFIASSKNAFGFENLGTVDYLSGMKWCSFMLGNTSSGFVEASYFPKVVINMGIRQQGRIVTDNIINCEIKKENILNAVKKAAKIKTVKIKPIYGDGKVAEKIIKILKTKYR
jgi:GDP/UDP-N,N'-diacetylbacillosamine 2-epimerase (hydrolysing)